MTKPEASRSIGPLDDKILREREEARAAGPLTRMLGKSNPCSLQGGEGQGWRSRKGFGTSCPLDAHDNDSVIGLVGHDLHPLSHRVQALRKTVQTSQYIQTLGPFFVGHALWQAPLR